MDLISASYIAFFLFGIVAILVWGAPRMVPIIYLLGLLILPVMDYPAPPETSQLSNQQSSNWLSPYWIVPTILPGAWSFSKSLVAAATIGIGIALGNPRSLQAFRFKLVDAPIIFWCLWPLYQSLFIATEPAGIWSSLYLATVWFIPWIAGRLYLGTTRQRLSFVKSIIIASLFLVPWALFEFVTGIRLYELIFGSHPFAAIGNERLIGSRPLLFFEDGNQYGLWMAMAALLALWRAYFNIPNGQKTGWSIAAVALVLTSLFSQSTGAILLLAVGVGVMMSAAFLKSLSRFFRPILLIGIISLAIYSSGIVPVRSLAKETAIGQSVVGAFKKAGQGSFTWRLSQDEKTLPAIRAEMPWGAGNWNWWEPLGRRPWGLPLLLAGQFGLLGFILAFASPLISACRRILSLKSDGRNKNELIRSPALPLTIAMFMAFADMWLNAFVSPLLLMIAGAIALRSAEEPQKSL